MAHDDAHCYRVATTAAGIAIKLVEEGTAVDIRTAYIAGLVHDLLDSKFESNDTTTSVEQNLTSLLKGEIGLDDLKISIIIQVARSVGYKNLIKPDWDVR